MIFSLLYTFCLHFYLINIHIFDYADSRLSGLFTEVPTSPDNRGSTVPLFYTIEDWRKHSASVIAMVLFLDEVVMKELEAACCSS